MTANGYVRPRRDAIPGLGDPQFDEILRRTDAAVHPIVYATLTARQRSLMQVINNEPALNIREIADRLGVQRTAAKYHVANLMRQGYLATQRQGRHLLHFASEMPPHERKTLTLLRIGSARLIVGVSFQTGGIDTADLSGRLGLSSRTVRSTIRILHHQGLIRLEKVPGTRTRRYHLEPNTRIIWARWFDGGRAGKLPPLHGEPTRLGIIWLFLLPWLTWSNA